MNYVTLLEIAHHIRSLPKSELSEMLGKIQNLSTLSMRDLDSETTRVGLQLLSQYAIKGLGGRDCIIIATMQLTNTKKILTHDASFRHVRGIDTEDTIPTRLADQRK